MENSLKEFEERYVACKKKDERDVLDRMRKCNEQLANDQDALALRVLYDLEEVVKQQDSMNRKLAKMLKHE